MHFGTVGIFLVFGLTAITFGITGILNNPQLIASTSQASVLTQVSAQTPTQTENIDYSRPSPGADYSLNSGGPIDGEIDGENAELENQLRGLRASMNPASLPTMWAHLGKINNEFGFRRNPFGGRAYEFHPGMDIDGERGEIVMATGNGTIISAGYKGGYGNMVEIDHGNGLTTRYGHMSKIEAQTGDTVTRGQLIGYIGSTGRSTGPHLHFELRLNDRPINPRHFLPPEPTDLTKIVKK